MIQEAGGVVDFDLPPPDVGKESGTLTPRIDWYVLDERMPLRDVYSPKSDQSISREAALAKRKGEVIKEARLNGIRPMTIERLLAFLGYDMGQPVMGTSEAVDVGAMRRLTGRRTGTPAAAKPAAEPKQNEEMKEDETKDEAKPKAKKGSQANTKKADDDSKKADDDTKKADDNDSAPK
jgi:hypothetical protein